MQVKTKAEFTMTAAIPSPVTVGNRVMLFTDKDMIQTSAVCGILYQDSVGIRFETKNSIYNIQYDERQASLSH